MTQAQTMHLPQAYRPEFAGFGATVREIVQCGGDRQTLALHTSD